MNFIRGNKQISLFMLLALLSGCTNYIVMPISEYDATDSPQVKRWNVRTVDGTIYSVKEFSIEDSEFVIVETGDSSKPYKDIFSYAAISDSDLPLTLKLEQIEALEYVELSYSKTALLIVASAAIVTFTVIAFFVTTLGMNN